MTLPITMPYAPMEALLVEEIPSAGGWQYEPKWDGFRCLAFREGEKVELQSKNGQSLGRYFPELVGALRELRAEQFVLDSEIVIPVDGSFSFDDLLQRIHPAESRIQRLAAERPALLIVFDLLVDAEGQLISDKPLRGRRRALEAFTKRYFAKNRRIRLSPATTNLRTAKKWFDMTGGALDGVMAKRLDSDYRSGERTAMEKIKWMRTADCVVGGFRYASNGPGVGSLLLGLYDEKGLLHHVGFTSGFPDRQRKELLRKLKPLIKPPGFTGNAPGGPSRWASERSAEWEPLVPKLVVEIRYDHFTGNRFRHGTKFLRWRPEKPARQCLMSQVQAESHSTPLGLTLKAK
jgi:ATP-dependent DNA ligase